MINVRPAGGNSSCQALACVQIRGGKPDVAAGNREAGMACEDSCNRNMYTFMKMFNMFHVCANRQCTSHLRQGNLNFRNG